MLFGILSDQKGKLKIAFWGMIIFMGASLLCGVSTQISEIIVFRIVQGIGAANVSFIDYDSYSAAKSK